MDATTHQVLYIEDNDANALLFKRIFQRLPTMSLTIIATGAEGLEFVRREKPRLVLLDLHLPGISGEEVLRAIRADETLSGCAVIIVTGDAALDTRARMEALGASMTLTKPIKVQQLIAAVEHALEIEVAS